MYIYFESQKLIQKKRTMLHSKIIVSADNMQDSYMSCQSVIKTINFKNLKGEFKAGDFFPLH